MKITLLKVPELSPGQLSTWSQVQQDDPALGSPFFRPEFTQSIAAVRDDVEVAILEEDGKPVGFFPFHRDKRDIAYPVGLGLSDCQGLVVGRDVQWAAERLLHDCRLKAWHFDHLLASQEPFKPHHWFATETSIIDLSDGFEAYRDEKRRLGHRTLKRAAEKTRKIERDLGPLRLVAHTSDAAMFSQLIEWKIEHYRQIRCVNHLAAEWKVEALRKIAATQLESFSGILSALYAGDHLLALHLGMQSGGVFHCWFPTYNREFFKYSPGLAFWVRLAQEAEPLGIECIDLGKGGERYKENLRTGTIALAEGSVDTRNVVSSFRWGWRKTRELVRSSPLRRPLQSVVRGIRSQVSYRNPPTKSGSTQ